MLHFVLSFFMLCFYNMHVVSDLCELCHWSIAHGIIFSDKHFAGDRYK